MQRIYRLVSEDIGINEKEVEEIYKLYLNDIRERILKYPEREVFFHGFGKFKPSIYKLKMRVRGAFQRRDKEKVKRHIQVLRKLNYNPKKYDN